MSYELVKRIVFKKDGVYLTSTSNNVSPKYYYSSKSNWFTNCLKESGIDEVIKEILWCFSTGSFQAKGNDISVNRYAKAAYETQSNEKYEELKNIYWCWDDVKREREETEKAKNDLKELLFQRYKELA